MKRILVPVVAGLFMVFAAVFLARPVSQAQTPPPQFVAFQLVFSTSYPVVAVYPNGDVQLTMADTGWSVRFSRDGRGRAWNIPNWEPVWQRTLVRVGDRWYHPSFNQVWRVVDGELRCVYSDSTRGYGYSPFMDFGDRWGAYVRTYTQAVVIYYYERRARSGLYGHRCLKWRLRRGGLWVHCPGCHLHTGRVSGLRVLSW